MPELTLEGLPVEDDIIGKYIVVQLSPSGRVWRIKVQRESLGYLFYAMLGLDLSRPTRICQVKRGQIVNIIRSWS